MEDKEKLELAEAKEIIKKFIEYMPYTYQHQVSLIKKAVKFLEETE